MTDNITYELIEHLRRAEEDFFDKRHLEGAFWAVHIAVYEMDNNFE